MPQPQTSTQPLAAELTMLQDHNNLLQYSLDAMHDDLTVTEGSALVSTSATWLLRGRVVRAMYEVPKSTTIDRECLPHQSMAVLPFVCKKVVLCIAAMSLPSVVTEPEGAISCRFEDQRTAPLLVRDTCRYLAMLPSRFAFEWPSSGLLASTCVGSGSGMPERWWRVCSMASQ